MQPAYPWGKSDNIHHRPWLLGLPTQSQQIEAELGMLMEEGEEFGHLLFGDGRIAGLLVELPFELDDLLRMLGQGYECLVSGSIIII